MLPNVCPRFCPAQWPALDSRVSPSAAPGSSVSPSLALVSLSISSWRFLHALPLDLCFSYFPCCPRFLKLHSLCACGRAPDLQPRSRLLFVLWDTCLPAGHLTWMFILPGCSTPHLTSRVHPGVHSLAYCLHARLCDSWVFFPAPVVGAPSTVSSFIRSSLSLPQLPPSVLKSLQSIL